MRGAGWVGALALLGTGVAFAAEPALPAIADRPAAELFTEAPAPWRDYLVRAREAERIADPLQRCLAYPDLPGNQWPAGHARSHCMDHALRAMALADARALLNAGKLAELDAYLRRVEAEHARSVDPSEEIHYFFQQFGAEDAGAFSAAWLAARPDSPHALTARATFHAAQAERVRGGKWSSETPRENLRQMTAHYDEALPLYRKAVANAPGFIDAWNGMLDLAYRDSRADLEQEAFTAANAIDAGCQDLVDIRMTSLQPRWGGSYEAMLAYAELLKPLLVKYPVLARQVAAPFGDRGDRLVAEDSLTREAMDILDIAVRISSNEDYLHDGANVAINATEGSKDPWKGLAYLLQEARFKDGGWWANTNIARMLVRADPAVSIRYAARAVENDPAKPSSRFYLAAGYYNTKRFDEAEKHYLLAARDKDWAQSSLDDLVRMWMFDAGLSPKAGSLKAKPHLDRLIREFPDDGRARMYRVQSEGALNGQVSEETVKAFEKHADPKDPGQARFLKALTDARKHRIMQTAPTKAK